MFLIYYLIQPLKKSYKLVKSIISFLNGGANYEGVKFVQDHTVYRLNGQAQSCLKSNPIFSLHHYWLPFQPKIITTNHSS